MTSQLKLGSPKGMVCIHEKNAILEGFWFRMFANFRADALFPQFPNFPFRAGFRGFELTLEQRF